MSDQCIQETDEFLISNKLAHLVPSFREAEVTVQDFSFLRKNSDVLKDFLPKLRDRIDFYKALQERMTSQGTQVSMEPMIKSPISLLDVCSHSTHGKIFVDMYVDEQGIKKFSADCRKHIKEAVVDYYFRLCKGHITQPTFFEMVSLITAELPFEKPRTWYAPSVGKGTASGLLYTKYRYLQQHDKRFKSEEQQPVISKMIINAEVSRKKWEDMTEAEKNKCKGAKNKINSIGFNRRTEIFELWAQTYPLRRYEAVTGKLSFTDWELFKHFDSMYELISQDFRQLFPDDKDVLVENIPDFVSRFSGLRHDYKSSFTEDEKLITALNVTFVKDFEVSEFAILLSFYCLPVILRKNFVYKGKKRIPISLLDSRQSFIVMLQTEAQILDTVCAKRRIAQANGDKIQPFMIVIGSLEDLMIHSIFIIIDELTIPCNNVSAAVDMLLKAHYVFQLQYSPKCDYVYHFIERYFYNVCEENEPCEPSVLSLISDFDRF